MSDMSLRAQFMPSVGGGHHRKNMIGIDGKCRTVLFQLVSQFKEQILALIVTFEEWLDQNIPLWQIAGVFSGITGGSRGRYTVFVIDKGGHGFV